MDITIAAQNLSHGGFRINDTEGNRWPLLFERLAPVAADILILNEATGWDADDNKLAHEFAGELGLHVAGVSPTDSDMPTAILYRKERLGEPRVWNVKHNYMVKHGFALAAWDVDGLPAPLTVLGTHLCPFSSLQARIEAQAIVSRAYRYGPYVIMAGDFNYPPLIGIPPDIEGMLPFNKMNRLNAPRSDNPTPDTSVAQEIYDGEFVDIAAELYTRSVANGTPDESYLAYTGRTDRIDWIVVSEALRACIIDYQNRNQPLDASDHSLVNGKLNLAAADTSDPWGYR